MTAPARSIPNPMHSRRACHAGATWLLVSLLGCTPQSAEQRSLHMQTAGMTAQEITLTCSGGSDTISILGNGAFLRSGGLIYVCTKPLAGGLACTAGDRRRVIDHEDRHAVFIHQGRTDQTCRY